MFARTLARALKIQRACATRSRVSFAAKSRKEPIGHDHRQHRATLFRLEDDPSHSNSAPVGTGDADILVSLAEKHRPTSEYTHALRDKLTQAFPGTEFYYLPTDMVSQILNFGLPAQIDVQVEGLQVDRNREIAEGLMQQISPHSRHHRPAHSAAVQPAKVDDQRLPHAGATGRLQPAGYCPGRPDPA